MKRIISLAAALILLVGMAAAPAVAAEATAAIDFASAYVWRGLTFNDGFVIQPSIDVAAKNGFAVNVWGNYDKDDYDNQVQSDDFSEIDLTVSYSKTFGKLDASVGVISYLFPGAGSDSETAEAYVSLGYPIVGGLSVSLDVYYDFELLDELSYATLGLSYAYDINDKVSLEAGATAGWAGEDFSAGYGGDDSGLWDYSLSLSVGYAITDAWSASAGVTHVGALDDDNLIDGNTAGTLDTETYATVGVAYAF
jgi:uncharacterized protein (TIGR02001 family)